VTNAFLSKRIAVLQREWLEPLKPHIILVRGGFPPKQPTPSPKQPTPSGHAHTVHPALYDDLGQLFSRPMLQQKPRRQAWSQRPGESVREFWRRVLTEANEAPWIIFYGLDDQLPPKPAYSDDPPGWSDEAA
jgi:hypothetical protein